VAVAGEVFEFVGVGGGHARMIPHLRSGVKPTRKEIYFFLPP
jgi:hypothetical protein